MRTCIAIIMVNKQFVFVATAVVVLLSSLLRTFARNFSNIDFFLTILPLKDDELAMSEMYKKGGSPTSFWREHARKNTQI